MNWCRNVSSHEPDGLQIEDQSYLARIVKIQNIVRRFGLLGTSKNLDDNSPSVNRWLTIGEFRCGLHEESFLAKLIIQFDPAKDDLSSIEVIQLKYSDEFWAVGGTFNFRRDPITVPICIDQLRIVLDSLEEQVGRLDFASCFQNQMIAEIRNTISWALHTEYVKQEDYFIPRRTEHCNRDALERLNRSPLVFHWYNPSLLHRAGYSSGDQLVAAAYADEHIHRMRKEIRGTFAFDIAIRERNGALEFTTGSVACGEVQVGGPPPT